MELSGKVIAVLELQQGTSASSGKEWKRQAAVIETDDQYPKKMVFDMFNDKIKPLQIGEVITVHFNVDAKEWQGKWFNQLTAYKIESEGVVQPASQPVVQPNTPQSNESTDLPF